MFISVDLKVIEGLAAQTARAASTNEDRILAGLVRLWHRVWSDGADLLSADELSGIFGGDGLGAVLRALVAFGFLEAKGKDVYRVRGASRYLRLKESRRRGGQARQGNVNGVQGSSALELSSKSTALEHGSLTDHRSPITDHRDQLPPYPPSQANGGKPQKLTRKQKRLNAGHAPDRGECSACNEPGEVTGDPPVCYPCFGRWQKTGQSYEHFAQWVRNQRQRATTSAHEVRLRDTRQDVLEQLGQQRFTLGEEPCFMPS